jgi:hypothetical protein
VNVNKRIENGTAVAIVRRYHGRQEVKVVTGGGRASLVLVYELYKHYIYKNGVGNVNRKDANNNG